MKTTVKLRIETEVLSAARRVAVRDGQPLDDFIEAALREKIATGDRVGEFRVAAPVNARDLKVLAEPGESEAETAEAQRLYEEMLDLAKR